MPAKGIARQNRMVRLGLSAGLAVSALVVPIAMATGAQAQDVPVATSHTAKTITALSASTTLTTATTSSTTVVAPLNTLRITEAYGVLGSRWSSGHHTGVDFAAATGTGVKAVTGGTVIRAGYEGSYGNDVLIKKMVACKVLGSN